MTTNTPTLNVPAPQVTNSSPLPSIHSLRILIVDDNHVNLAILSTLLKRRFGHILACPPVALDSGLKAIQTLRTEVFDLIFMDIEMPYLNGVECTRRIRATEDGILPANSSAHIIAVTTNVGDVPGSLYQQVGMNGMISKPVRFEHFRQYLYPLSLEARHAQGYFPPSNTESGEVLPPMPPTNPDDREFFTVTSPGSVPHVATKESSDDGGVFAAMLTAQSKQSLSDRKAVSLARSGTVALPRRSSFNSPRSEHLPAIRSTKLQQSVVARSDSFEVLVDKESDFQDRLTEARRPRSTMRPVPAHRLSSPAYMLEASPDLDMLTYTSKRIGGSSDALSVLAAPDHKRPSIRPRQGQRLDFSFDARASTSSQVSGTSGFSDQSDADSRNDSPASALTTPLSSPAEQGTDWECMFSKASFGMCVDDLPSPSGVQFWDQNAVRTKTHANRQPSEVEPLTRPQTSQSF